MISVFSSCSECSQATTHSIQQTREQQLEAPLVGNGKDGAAEEGEEDEEEDEEEEMPDVGNMTRGQIYAKSLFLILFGVGVVTVFSDPMVTILSTLGDRMGISPFYVSFIVTPLVSNASELISSLVFAGKRTKKSITMTFSTLLGAASMNNTFGLAIFLALVYFQNLSWEFSAEVMSILLIEIIMALVAMRRVQSLLTGILVLLLFPLSIVFVAVLEGPVGWD